MLWLETVILVSNLNACCMIPRRLDNILFLKKKIIQMALLVQIMSANAINLPSCSLVVSKLFFVKVY